MNDDSVAKTLDPDLEVILSLLQGVTVPTVTVLSVLSNLAGPQTASQQKREQVEETRAARQIAMRMIGALDEAKTLLRWTNEFLLEHNFAQLQVWPSGINGLQLSEEAFDRYMEIIDHCCTLIRRADRDGMELSGYAQLLHASQLLGVGGPTQWQRDLHQARLIQEKVMKAHTYGQKCRQLKLSIHMCRHVLERFQNALREHQAPPAVSPQTPGRTA